MATTTLTCEVDVCTDCYFAHHYGYTFHDGLFFSGDSDEGADLQPLNRLSDVELTDKWASCEGHFSYSSCEGCGSHLGGTRFTLAVWA